MKKQKDVFITLNFVSWHDKVDIYFSHGARNKNECYPQRCNHSINMKFKFERPK